LNNCPFCHADMVLENDLAYARYDLYPVNKGHLLIIPKRHFPDFFEATPEERAAIFDMTDQGKALLDNKHSPDGYNIGINAGIAAGQTVMHLHVHLIPRYDGDMPDPRGGVRGVIPEKQSY
jgi:diadenosine tetraphosphate (Ap4A) HIT family hydrolase